MIIGIIQAVVNIPLSILFANGVGLGIVGIRLGTLVAVLFGEIYQLAYYHRLIRKNMNMEET